MHYFGICFVAENNYSATKECASIHSQIMENISKLGWESECLTPYSNALLQCCLCYLDGWFTFYSDKRGGEKNKKTNLNRDHKPVVSQAPVFKLTKGGNAFGLNLKQQQVLNTSMCPLAVIKHKKKRETRYFPSLFLLNESQDLCHTSSIRVRIQLSGLY